MVRFFDRLKASADDFTHSQRTIAAYMQEHAENIAFCNLETLASKIGVSTTTIIRFSRALGYTGFTDMQKAVKDEIQNKSALPDRLNSMRTSTGNELLRESFEMDKLNIEKTFAAQNEKMLRSAINAIIAADNIYLLGFRSSFSLAYYMASRLGEIRRNVHCVQSTGMLYPEEIINAQENDICIAFLFPRYSKTAISVLEWLKKQKVKIILFTSLTDTASHFYGDILLPCSLESCSYKNSFTAPICLSNYLVAETAKQNSEEAREMLTRAESILNPGYYMGL